MKISFDRPQWWLALAAVVLVIIGAAVAVGWGVAVLVLWAVMAFL